MRFLLLVFLLTLTLNAAAQSPEVTKLQSEGTKYANEKRFDVALERFKAALSIAENEYTGAGYRAKLHYNIGVCYFRLERFEQASDKFKQAVLLDASYSPAHNALGVTRKRNRSGTSVAISSRLE